jgi:protein required for attachment to host cells
MPSTWVVVADQSAARIFDAPTATGALEEIESYAHAEGRAHARDLKTDQPGRAFDSVGAGRHGMEPSVLPKEQEAISFARFLNAHLEDARTKNKVERLILVAPPEFLGHLRNTMDKDAKKIVQSDHALNVVRLRPEEIRGRLPERLY